jgi:hypothetical protein
MSVGGKICKRKKIGEGIKEENIQKSKDVRSKKR